LINNKDTFDLTFVSKITHTESLNYTDYMTLNKAPTLKNINITLNK